MPLFFTIVCFWFFCRLNYTSGISPLTTMALESDYDYGTKMDSLAAQKPIFFKSSDNDEARDSGVWNAFREGNREAFDYIFRHHASGLFAYGSRFTKDDELVHDAIQDLFVELWNRRQNLSETNSIRFYLLKALRRRIARTLLGMKRSEAIAEDMHYIAEKIHFSVEHLLVMRETEQFKRAHLKKAMESLTRRQREAIYLKFFQGLNNQAIASVMGLSYSSVNTLVSQAISALRGAL